MKDREALNEAIELLDVASDAARMDSIMRRTVAIATNNFGLESPFSEEDRFVSFVSKLKSAFENGKVKNEKSSVGYLWSCQIKSKQPSLGCTVKVLDKWFLMYVPYAGDKSGILRIYNFNSYGRSTSQRSYMVVVNEGLAKKVEKFDGDKAFDMNATPDCSIGLMNLPALD